MNPNPYLPPQSSPEPPVLALLVGEDGGISVDFPIGVQGRIDREIVANIGAGGPAIRVHTHNGGVKVSRK